MKSAESVDLEGNLSLLGRIASIATLLLLAIGIATATLAQEQHTVPGREWTKLAQPSDTGWSKDKLAAAKNFSSTLDTAAVMIVHKGIVVEEWGATALPLMCHSVRKSLLSALFGLHVASGSIDLNSDLQQLGINDNEPSLTAKERKAQLGHLLKARSGIFHPALYETAAMAAARPARGSHAPNSFWYYNNWDFNASGAIFENLTGRSIFEEFENRIAAPLSMQDFRRDRDTQYVTGDDSVYPAYPFRLSTRDLARFGLLFLRGGRWGDEQLIPKDWITESTASYSSAGASGGYGYMWWVAVDGKHFPGVTLPQGSYSARGYRGQYLVVIPKWDLVICHRVNSFQKGTSVSKTEFGKLLGMLLAARPSEELVVQEPSTQQSDFDVIIRNGFIIDGTGIERFVGDIAIRNDRITEIGQVSDAKAHFEIEAAGKIVAPGFIDLHSHAEEGLVSNDPSRRSAPNLITQGITTVVVNQDGGGPLDLVAQRQQMQRLGTGLNVCQVIGHGTIRHQVMGDDYQRRATADEVRQMQRFILSACDAGAYGLSAGLEYEPGRWSTIAEMESLASTVAKRDGVYIVHERSSGSRPMWFLPSRDEFDQPSMLDNLQELIGIASLTKVRTVATHIKARGTDFWSSSSKMNELIRTARAQNIPIFADQYAYNTSGSDGRIVLIPSWVTSVSKSDELKEEPIGTHAEQLQRVLENQSLSNNVRQDIAYEIERRGGAANILIVDHPEETLIGKSLADYATKLDSAPVDAAIALQLEGFPNRRGGAQLRAFSMSEKDVEAFAMTPWTATSSDAGITLPTDDPVHPRFYGAFPRKIRHYAIDRGLMSVEEAIRVSTSLPANILDLKDRGVLREGAFADIVIFDPNTIRDTASPFQPHKYAEGIEFVFLNGQLVCEQGRWIGNLCGQVLRKRKHEPTTIRSNR